MSADGKWVIAHDLTEVHVCDVAAGTCRSISKEPSIYGSTMLTPDGSRAVIARSAKLLVYDRARGTAETIARRHELVSVAISEDGQTVGGVERAEGGPPYPVFVRDVASGEERVLPAGTGFELIVLHGMSATVLQHGEPPIVFDSLDTFPRDATLQAALTRLTNAVIVKGVVTAPR